MRVGALLRTLALAALLVGCADEPPHILLVTLDTTRADHLGAYGHRRDTSPHFDALAAEGTLHTRAYSTSSWTLPSHASLFTGKFPSSHGARYDPKGALELGSEIVGGNDIRASGLSPEETTLAERLAGRGYATAGFVAGPWLLRAFGLARGFEHWDDEDILDVNGRPGDALADAVLGWLDRWRAEDARRPFFVFVNFFDAHYPYTPPSKYARMFLPANTIVNQMDRAQFDALYDAEIRFADEQLGRLLEYLREHGLYEDTLVVVTADHGEMLGEHDAWGHNGILFEPLVRIPLAIKPPGPTRSAGDGEPVRDEDPIQHPGIYDRVLAAAGLPVEDAPRPRLAEVFHPSAPGVGEWKALWEGDLKLMTHSDGDDRLYDLSRDRRERVNQKDRRGEDVARLRTRLAEALAALPEPLPGGAPVEIDARTREALERLGYLGGSDVPAEPDPIDDGS